MNRTPAQASPPPQLHTPSRGLPRLSHRRDQSTPLTSRRNADATPDLSMFSNISNGARATPDNRTAQRFFSQVKRRAPSVMLEEGGRLKFSETASRVKERTWDLVERLEAYELKCIQANEFPRTLTTVVTQYGLWEECLKELLLLMKNKDVVQVFEKLSTNLATLFSEYKNTQETQERNQRKTTLEQKKQIKQLEAKVLALQGASEELLRVKLMEEEQIKKEIDEIFGHDDSEYVNFRKKSKKLQEVEPTGATDILRDLYMEMTKDRLIPTANKLEVEYLDPRDIQQGLLQNLVNVQRSTASTVFRLIESRIKRSDASQQTEGEVVDKEEFDELFETHEKAELMHQVTASQFERLQEDYSQKLTLIQKADAERTELKTELLRYKREAESLEQDLKYAHTENKQLKTDKIEMNKTNDLHSKELASRDDVVFRLQNKIKELTETIERSQASMAKKEEIITELQRKLGKKKHVVTEEEAKVKKIKGSEEKTGEWEMDMPEIDVMERKPRQRRVRQRQELPDYPEVDELEEDTQQPGAPSRRSSPKQTGLKKLRHYPDESSEEAGEEEEGKTRRVPKHRKPARGQPSPKQKGPGASGVPGAPGASGASGATGARGTKDSTLARDPAAPNREFLFHQDSDNSQPSISQAEDDVDIPGGAAQKKFEVLKRGEPQRQRVPLPRKIDSIRSRVAGPPNIDTGSGSALGGQFEEKASSPIQVQRRHQDRHQPQYADTYMPSAEHQQSENSHPWLSADKVDKEVTVDLIEETKAVITRSIGTYYNSDNPDAGNADAPGQDGPTIYLLPFNPNNIYGLKGDSYYNTRTQVFFAQPRIPETQDSLVFQSPYKTSQPTKKSPH